MTALHLLLALALVLTPLVALHEWGHYIVARLCGVKVLTYSIGMGPKICGWTSKKTGIDYRLSLLPIGGYVKMLDEREGEVAEAQKPLAFNNQHPLKKLAIVLAGPLMNFIIAVGLFFVLLLQPVEQLTTHIGRIADDSPASRSGLVAGEKITHIDQKSVNTWQEMQLALADRVGESGIVVVQTQAMQSPSQRYQVAIERFMQGVDKGKNPLQAFGVLPWQPAIPAVVGEITPGSSAQVMGLKVGDTITAIDGKPIKDWRDVAPIVQPAADELLQFSILRDGKALTMPIMPQTKRLHGQNIGQIGVLPKPPPADIPSEFKMTIKHSPAEALYLALRQSYDMTAITLRSIGKMLSGLVGVENLSGPIMIAEISKQSLELGLLPVLHTAAMLSLSLAVLNLLPIPVLDGGHAVYALYELIAGRALSERLQLAGLNIGMLLLLGVMLLATSNDITRLFG